MITYRIAQPVDIGQIKTLTDSMLAHTHLGVATLDKIERLVSNKNCHFDLAFDDQQCVGFMLGIKFETLFNDTPRVSDIGMYVDSKYRGGRIVLNLLNRFETWAKDCGASQIWLGQTTGDNIEKTRHFYERRGYTVVGVNCIKEL